MSFRSSLAGGEVLISAAFDARFKPPALPEGFSAGHLVVRPEFLRFLKRRARRRTALSGRLYNEYALGSRIQYQVRVGDHVFIVEKLRQQAFGRAPRRGGPDRLGRRGQHSGDGLMR